MNPIQTKIQRTGRVVSVFSKILYISLIVAVCIQATGILWQASFPDSGSFMLGAVRVLSPFAKEGPLSSLELAKLAATIVNECFLAAMVILCYRIFKDISRENSPFSPKHALRMRRIGRLLFIDAIVAPVVEVSMCKTFGVEPQLTSDFSSAMIVLGIILYCFALIFEYGAQLQQQSDETL